MNASMESLAPGVVALIEDLGDVPYSVEPSLVRRRSRDYFWYSQVLARELEGKRAEAAAERSAPPKAVEKPLLASLEAIRKRLTAALTKDA